MARADLFLGSGGGAILEMAVEKPAAEKSDQVVVEQSPEGAARYKQNCKEFKLSVASCSPSRWVCACCSAGSSTTTCPYGAGPSPSSSLRRLCSILVHDYLKEFGLSALKIENEKPKLELSTGYP
ncbi:hypothetical protein E2562_005081 [Oryza meyeriana var. granulata]|uniref:Uncharacterized protein n=1 Tax=Oryza meyeriana var. granulata TaxID=110450 RepID=A0A6G1BSL5_9ORYZ|nr:hypothetical protein E2562_005081 [Oryza meyeriana var. granulata]